jgi:hypothetical protein
VGWPEAERSSKSSEPALVASFCALDASVEVAASVLRPKGGSGEKADLLILLEEPEWRGQVIVDALRRVETRT